MPGVTAAGNFLVVAGGCAAGALGLAVAGYCTANPADQSCAGGRVERFKTTEGLDAVRLTHSSGSTAEVLLHGATVTKFATAAGEDVLFLSSLARLDGSKAVRGGIPVVFPQFGRPDEKMAQHGFARNTLWKLEDRVDSATGLDSSGGAACTMLLTEQTASDPAWPYKYALRLTVAVNGPDTLVTALRVENMDVVPFTFQALLHTYYSIPAISEVTVSMVGMEGLHYYDKVAPADASALVSEKESSVKISSETDRVYVNTNADDTKSFAEIRFPGGGRQITFDAKLHFNTVESILPVDAVLWNPWVAKAKDMGDFDNDGYERMVCVEPGVLNPANTGMSLKPQQSVTLRQEICAK